MNKVANDSLPTIGILIFDKFLSNEVLAPLDVFTKADTTGKKLFNVILIATENRPIVSEEGLKVIPDRTIDTTPVLSVLIVPSSMNPKIQAQDAKLIDFIRKQNRSTDYIASHCAGAFLLGEAGVADGKQIVTYCGGKETLQQTYPELVVLDDVDHRVVQDKHLFSSNGNLVSYLGSFELLEALTSYEHRKHVEHELLFDKLIETKTK